MPANSRLEALGRKYVTDKDQYSHGYLALYNILFSQIASGVVNMTEVGLQTGGSALMWMDYFPNAHLYGVDIHTPPALRQRLGPKIAEGRMTLLQHDSTECVRMCGSVCECVSPLASEGRFAEGSMDIVLDDGAHTEATQQATLVNLWPFVRPGGYYLVEDVLVDYDHTELGEMDSETGRKHRGPATPSFVHYRGRYHQQTLEILRRNDVFIADTLSANVGGRSWRDGVTERVHDSHVVVICKREGRESYQHHRAHFGIVSRASTLR